MTKQFNTAAHIDSIGKELILAFESASGATTPGLIGSAREVPVRHKLEQLLPKGMAIGEGCLLDIHGNTSNQQDLVLYEKDICPVFSINNTPESTYYPCEGVIAVGEVKSTLNTSQLEDALVKIKSARTLRRIAIETDDALGSGKTVSYRKYGSVQGLSGTPDESYDQDGKPSDQIYTFIIAKELSVKPVTFANTLKSILTNVDMKYKPNCICIVNEGCFVPVKIQAGQSIIMKSIMEADTYIFIPSKKQNFAILVNWLFRSYLEGRSVSSSVLRQYLEPQYEPEGDLLYL